MPANFYFTEVFNLENWINLDNLPRRNDGKIDWKNCNHNLVNFYYNGISDNFYIIKRLCRHYVLVNYRDHSTVMNTDSINNCRLDSILRFNQDDTDDCSDEVVFKHGISFPNRLMASVLKNLHLKFSSEVYFEWCTFPSYSDKARTSRGRFDFYIHNTNIIIEMDGGFGHGHDTHPKSNMSKEEAIYRDSQKDMLANKNGYQVIRIDSNYRGDRFEYCKNNIINKLSEHYDLNSINWESVKKNCMTNIAVSIIELYKSGLSAIEISERLDYDYTCVLKYLYEASRLGLCKYYKYIHPVTNGDVLKIYNKEEKYYEF